MHLETPILTLLVEDDDDSAMAITSVLETAPMGKFLVRRRKTVKEAKEFLTNEKPIDLVILDLRLPNGTGIAVVREIKSVASCIPVVIITGMDDANLAVESISQLADDYLVKASHSNREIQERVTNSVIRCRARQEYAKLNQAVESLDHKLEECQRDPSLPPYKVLPPLKE